MKGPVSHSALQFRCRRIVPVVLASDIAGCDGDSLKRESFGRQHSTCTEIRIKSPAPDAVTQTESSPGLRFLRCQLSYVI